MSTALLPPRRALEPGRPAGFRVFIAALGMRKAQADGCTCVQQPCSRSAGGLGSGRASFVLPNIPRGALSQQLDCGVSPSLKGSLLPCCCLSAGIPQPAARFEFFLRELCAGGLLVLGGHCPVLNWSLGMWSEPVPLVLDRAPFQRSPGPPVLLLWGVGGSRVLLLLRSSCCPRMPAGAGGLCYGAGSFLALREFALIAAGF